MSRGGMLGTRRMTRHSMAPNDARSTACLDDRLFYLVHLLLLPEGTKFWFKTTVKSSETELLSAGTPVDLGLKHSLAQLRDDPALLRVEMERIADGYPHVHEIIREWLIETWIGTVFSQTTRIDFGRVNEIHDKRLPPILRERLFLSANAKQSLGKGIFLPHVENVLQDITETERPGDVYSDDFLDYGEFDQRKGRYDYVKVWIGPMRMLAIGCKRHGNVKYILKAPLDHNRNQALPPLCDLQLASTSVNVQKGRRLLVDPNSSWVGECVACTFEENQAAIRKHQVEEARKRGGRMLEADLWPTATTVAPPWVPLTPPAESRDASPEKSVDAALERDAESLDVLEDGTELVEAPDDDAESLDPLEDDFQAPIRFDSEGSESEEEIFDSAQLPSRIAVGTGSSVVSLPPSPTSIAAPASPTQEQIATFPTSGDAMELDPVESQVDPDESQVDPDASLSPPPEDEISPADEEIRLFLQEATENDWEAILPDTRRDVDSLHQLEETRSIRRALEEQLEKEQSSLRALEEQLEKEQSRRRALEEQLEKEQSSLRALEELGKEQSRRRALEELHEKATANLVASKASKVAVDKEILALREKLAASNRGREEAEQRANERQGTIDKLREEDQERQNVRLAEKQQETNRVNAKQEEIDCLNARLAEQGDQRKAAQDEVAVWKSRAEEYLRVASSLQTTLNATAEEAEELKKRAADEKKRADEAQQLAEKEQKRAEEEKKTTDEAQKHAADENKRAEQEKQRADELAAKLAAHLARYRQMEADLANSRHEQAKLTDFVAGLQNCEFTAISSRAQMEKELLWYRKRTAELEEEQRVLKREVILPLAKIHGLDYTQYQVASGPLVLGRQGVITLANTERPAEFIAGLGALLEVVIPNGSSPLENDKTDGPHAERRPDAADEDKLTDSASMPPPPAPLYSLPPTSGFRSTANGPTESRVLIASSARRTSSWPHAEASSLRSRPRTPAMPDSMQFPDPPLTDLPEVSSPRKRKRPSEK